MIKITKVPPAPPRDDVKFQQYQFDDRLDRNRGIAAFANQEELDDEDRGNTFYEKISRLLKKDSKELLK